MDADMRCISNAAFLLYSTTRTCGICCVRTVYQSYSLLTMSLSYIQGREGVNWELGFLFFRGWEIGFCALGLGFMKKKQ